MEIKLNEVDVSKLNLQEGEVLVVKMRGDEFCNADTLTSLRNELQMLFPNNRVAVLCMPTDHDITFEIAASQKETNVSAEPLACGPGPADYCSDCGCGKREAYERNK